MGLGIKTRLLNSVDYMFKLRLPHLRYKLYNDTTQYGELSYLQYLLGNKPGIVVDVGANDGFTCSNSYPFLHTKWSGLLIEPHPRVFEELSKLYASNEKVQLLNVACGEEQGELPLFEGSDDRTVYATLSTEESDWYDATRGGRQYFVKVERLEDILSSQSIPPSFDLLSVDTEGFDYFVLKGMNLSRFRPQVIITEDEKPPFTHTAAKEELLRSNGYRLGRRFHNNAIWIQEKAKS